jgi:hypothetical protein
MKKDLEKKEALIKTHYEEGILQPTPAGQSPADYPPLSLSPRYFERKLKKNP